MENTLCVEEEERSIIDVGASVRDAFIDTIEKETNSKEKELPLITHELDNDFKYWPELLEELRGLISRTMKLVSSRELTGESEKGINELAFKMVILSHLSTKYETLRIISEREVEGGRIDIFLQNIKTESILIIELKYVRIGFLENSAISPNATYLKKYALYKKVNDEICGMKMDALKSVINRRYVKKNGPISVLQKEPLSDIMQSALEQSKRYCSALLDGGVNPVNNNTLKLYYTAITGVGTRVIVQELVRFNK